VPLIACVFVASWPFVSFVPDVCKQLVPFALCIVLFCVLWRQSNTRHGGREIESINQTPTSKIGRSCAHNKRHDCTWLRSSLVQGSGGG